MFQIQNSKPDLTKARWSKGRILASGARVPGFESWTSHYQQLSQLHSLGSLLILVIKPAGLEVHIIFIERETLCRI